MKIVQQFDPTLDMGDDIVTIKSHAAGWLADIKSDDEWAKAALKETFDYWESMVQPDGDITDAHLTINTFTVDNAPMSYIMVIHYESGTYSADIHHILPTDQGEDDVYNQCHSCGRVHAHNETNFELDIPVTRQSLDGYNHLCDDCADNELRAAYTLTTGKGSDAGYFEWLMKQRGPTAIGI